MRDNQGGFSYVGLLVVSVLFLTVATGTFRGMVVMSRAVLETRLRALATCAAQSKLEELKNVPGLRDGRFDFDLSPQMRKRMGNAAVKCLYQCETVEREDVSLVTVRVSWRTSCGQNEVVLATLVD